MESILKVARTIADLKGTAAIDHHFMEAIAYRNLDRPTYLGSSLYEKCKLDRIFVDEQPFLRKAEINEIRC